VPFNLVLVATLASLLGLRGAGSMTAAEVSFDVNFADERLNLTAANGGHVPAHDASAR
jgi:hypothetical protein